MARPALAVTLLAAACAWALWDATAGPGWFIDGPLVVLLPAATAYAVGATARPLVTVPAAGAGTVLTTLANQLDSDAYPWWDDLVFFAVVVAGPAAAGAAVAVRRRQVGRLRRLRAELDEQHRIDVAAARLEEQTRIQQEVHARLAERIGGIVVRAEGAQRARDADALSAIEAEARGVLDQLRGVLGSLGSDPAPETAAAKEPGRPRPSTLDIALAVAIAAGLGLEGVLVGHARGPTWANVLGALLVGAPLVVRRSQPIAAVTASFAAGALTSVWLTPVTETVTGVALMVLAFYTIGAWCRGWWWLAGWVLALAGTVALEAASGLAGDAEEGDALWIMLIWAVGAVAVGRVTAGWQERVRRIEETLAALGRRQDAEVRLAVARERQALASSLHDTVAHAMTVVCLHAGAPRRTDGDAATALQTITATAAGSLAELRDGLDAIESTDDPLDAARLADLGRRMGIDLVVHGSWGAPGPAGVLGFRVVREALVNVARHAPDAAAELTITRHDGRLVVELVDSGAAAGVFATGSGRGLAGLAEAVAELGGAFESGPHGDGFRVLASIPAGTR